MSKPLIGITAYDFIRPGTDWRYDVSYGRNAAAIEEAGGLPVLIPSHVSNETLRAIYDRLDGVLLPGGGDVNPDLYQNEKHDKVYGINDFRDSMEIQLAQWAVADDVPVFGICRGIQVMNVALGGTLVQDIPARIQTNLRHSIDTVAREPRHTLLHDVTIKEGSILASILGEKHIMVNSIHHQALRDVAPSATVSALSPDGIVEGIELPDKHFALAVQWHPEDLADNDARMQNLFTTFVNAARERIKQKQ
jgi:putative glutamine amidotransferase